MNRIGLLGIISIMGLYSCKTTNLFVGKYENRDSIPLLDSAFLPDSNYQYRIRRDDKITISLWGQDDMSVG